MKAFCIVAFAALVSMANAQEEPSTAPPVGVEELIVRGRTIQQLRLEIEKLEDAVYERFNELNSNDDFDIFCYEQAQTGSNVPQRTCIPKFALRADERAARTVLCTMQTACKGFGGNAQIHYARMEQKGEELTAEMARVAREDEQLMQELTRLAKLRETQRASRQRHAAR
jgi:hypothetical protein